MSDQIRNDVAQFLSTISVSFSASYMCETKRDNDWTCDQWRVTFARPSKMDLTEFYFTGTGLRKQVQKMPQPPFRKGTVAYAKWEKTAFKPQAPSAADVLYSLVRDAEAMHESFGDWCSGLGYDEDSMKAFRIYQDCCEIGKKLVQFFSKGELDKIRELTEDM